LAYANEHRPWELFQSVFFALLSRCRQVSPGRHPLRFKNPLLSLDATTIDLCASLFNWAAYKRSKGAVKLHLLLDHDGFLPTFAVITEGKRGDIEVARKMRFPTRAVVVFDRAYEDHAWFDRLTEQGVFFVTRMKSYVLYRVLEKREVPQRGGILRDETIRLKGTRGGGVCLFRRVEMENPEDGKILVFLTNHLGFGPTTIAAIYKQRWQIELLFKALKQNLRVKTFVGTSPNALKTQIWTALITLLLLRYLKLKARFGWSLSNLVAMLRFNLFTHRDLWTFLDDPFHQPEDWPPPASQLSFAQIG
jgi:hypothetical protein